MANRIALRDLQARLAERLEQARGQAAVSGWLAVEVASGGYLLPLAQSGEIFPFTLPMKVPYTLDWFSGVVNLRGGVYGVVDLRRFLLGDAAPSRTEFARSQSRYVGFNSALELNSVLMVDGLAGLRNPQSFVHEEETSGEGPRYLGARLIDEQGRVWQEIDLQKLATDEHFLSVSASQLALH
ncbi:MAG: hypothetical protein RLZZ271_223 [Pseudomonadota bacterium]|jgi:twitching motility protein PilI